MTEQEIALFPIPQLVAFPGTTVPLHVFEPRYRQMVHDAVRDQRMIGVCHTRKQINPGKGGDTLTEALSNNQATYQPYEVFSAGNVEIVETTPDGRIHANIHIVDRFQIEREVQTLPYRIVEASVVDDEEPESDETLLLQDRVNKLLLGIIGTQNPRAAEMLESPDWLDQSPAELSYHIFQFLRFDPDLMQEILEMRSARERLELIHTILSQATPSS